MTEQPTSQPDRTRRAKGVRALGAGVLTASLALVGLHFGADKHITTSERVEVTGVPSPNHKPVDEVAVPVESVLQVEAEKQAALQAEADQQAATNAAELAAKQAAQTVAQNALPNGELPGANLAPTEGPAAIDRPAMVISTDNGDTFSKVDPGTGETIGEPQDNPTLPVTTP